MEALPANALTLLQATLERQAREKLLIARERFERSRQRWYRRCLRGGCNEGRAGGEARTADGEAATADEDPPDGRGDWLRERAFRLIPIVKDGYLMDLGSKTSHMLQQGRVLRELRAILAKLGEDGKTQQRGWGIAMLLLAWFVFFENASPQRRERRNTSGDASPTVSPAATASPTDTQWLWELKSLLVQLVDGLSSGGILHQSVDEQPASSIRFQKNAGPPSEKSIRPPAWYCQVESDVYFIPENFKRFAKLRNYDGYGPIPEHIGHVWATVSERAFGAQKLGFSTEVTQGLCFNRKALEVWGGPLMWGGLCLNGFGKVLCVSIIGGGRVR